MGADVHVFVYAICLRVCVCVHMRMYVCMPFLRIWGDKKLVIRALVYLHYARFECYQRLCTRVCTELLYSEHGYKENLSSSSSWTKILLRKERHARQGVYLPCNVLYVSVMFLALTTRMN
jgi:hypothetical protein